MKASAKRRVEREVRRIMREDGDHCSLCRAAFSHNGRTFGGVTMEGTPRLVGECCQNRLNETILMGLFVTKDADDAHGWPTGDRERQPSGNAEDGVAALQTLFEHRAAESADISRRAGFSTEPAEVYRQNSAWKDDDARWFVDHPDRSHRLRPVIGDEAETCGFTALGAMPPKHALQILVRQVSPGARVRTPFGRNLEVAIPDDEAVLHALFDIVQSGRVGDDRVISATQLLLAVSTFAQHRNGAAN